MTTHTHSEKNQRSYQEDRFIIKLCYSKELQNKKIKKITNEQNDFQLTENIMKFMIENDNDTLTKSSSIKTKTETKTETETECYRKIPIDIIGVFDGHGGADISEYLSKRMHQYFYKENIFIENIPMPNDKYTKYIVDTFDEIQKELNIKHNGSTSQGSTVCICLIYGYAKKKYITTAWCGDSRAVACDQQLMAINLSMDHKPNYPREYQRIVKAGGTVIAPFDRNDVHRVNGVLAVSRSMGDLDHKAHIEHKPEVTHKLCDYKFIIVATDGLWDVMDGQMAVNFVIEQIIADYSVVTENKSTIPAKLAKKAIEMGSEDNITIIIYFLDNREDDYRKYFV